MTRRQEREQLVLQALERFGGWVEPRDVQRVLRDHGTRLPAGAARDLLDGLADTGRCERQRTGGTGATFRATLRKDRP